MLFAKPTKAIGLDVGTHSVKAVQMSKASGRLRVERVGYALIDRGEFNLDPVRAQAMAVREALRVIPTNQSIVLGALPGQTVVIRYPRLQDLPDNQLSAAVEKEAGQNIPYELSEVFLDWSPLAKITEGNKTLNKVLLVAARYEIIDSRVQVAEEAGIQFSTLGVDSLALADAAEACDFLRVGESVAMVNLGSSSTSIHFVKDGVSNFIRDVNWGARELLQAIMKARRCEFAEAERLLQASSVPEPIPAPPPLPGQSAPESAEPEKPAAPSGGNLLDPLDDELGALGALGDLAAEPAPAAAPTKPQPQEKSIDELISLPLAKLVSELRRSFDYYEQQLYEQPVDRLILSGGSAELPLVHNMLAEELSIPVEVADPSQSAIYLNEESQVYPMLEHPPQFMVAVGLAARGVAEL